MRVLWISCRCSLQDKEDNQCLTARHEGVMASYGGGRIKLGVAFQADSIHNVCTEKDGISYYPVLHNMGIGAKEDEWQKAAAELKDIIDAFRPDVIQCFGAEWPCGRIAEETDVPVIIHMMGFLNIYYQSLSMIPGYRKPRSIQAALKKSLIKLAGRSDEAHEKRNAETEQRVMSANRYFVGRTEWDRRIVKYYSPGATYYHVPEAVKQSIYDAAGSWKYHYDGKLRLFTHSLNDERKGIGIILITARLLKELTDIDFTWRIAGGTEAFRTAEKQMKINGRDVNIELLGMQDDSHLIREMTEADLCIHPSIIDNSPHSICEAQLTGCPVIASNVGGVPQLIDDGRTGFLYPYNEPHTLAFLIADLCGNEKLLSEVSENAVRTALDRHEPKQLAETLIGIYSDVMKERER